MDILLALVASFFAAFIPTCIYIALAWWLDRYEREPLWLLTIAFLWGAVPAIILALIAQILLDIPLETLATGFNADLVSASLIAPVTEELAKAIPLLLIYWLYRKEFDGLMDGLIYGALVGFGFSMTENILYFIGAYSEGGWESWSVLVFLRAIIFGLNHALFTSAFGAALGFIRYAANPFMRWLAPLIGLFMAMLLHGIHNFFVSWPGAELLCLVSLFSDWLGVLVWLGLVWFATGQEKKWIRAELSEEVANGLLPQQHALAAASYRTRLRDRWATIKEKGFGPAHRLNQLHHLATELALKKRQLHIHGEEQGNSQQISKLREEIAKLVGELA